MKLRLRQAGTSNTRRIQLPDDCTLAVACEAAAREFHFPVGQIDVSLNQRNILGQAIDASNTSLRSLGVCGGDMLYIHLSERSAHEASRASLDRSSSALEQDAVQPRSTGDPAQLESLPDAGAGNESLTSTHDRPSTVSANRATAHPALEEGASGRQLGAGSSSAKGEEFKASSNLLPFGAERSSSTGDAADANLADSERSQPKRSKPSTIEEMVPAAAVAVTSATARGTASASVGEAPAAAAAAAAARDATAPKAATGASVSSSSAATTTAAAVASSSLLVAGVVRPSVTASLIHTLLARALAQCLHHHQDASGLNESVASESAVQRESSSSEASPLTSDSKERGDSNAADCSTTLTTPAATATTPSHPPSTPANHEATNSRGEYPFTRAARPVTRGGLSLGHMCLAAAVHAAMLDTGFSPSPSPSLPPTPSLAPSPSTLTSPTRSGGAIATPSPLSLFSIMDNPAALSFSYMLNPTALSAALPPTKQITCMVSLRFLPLASSLLVYGSVSPPLIPLASQPRATAPLPVAVASQVVPQPRAPSRGMREPTTRMSHTPSPASPSSSPTPLRLTLAIPSHVSSTFLERNHSPLPSPSSLPSTLPFPHAIPLWCLLKDRLALPLLYACARAVSCTCTASPLPHMHPLPLPGGASTVSEGESVREKSGSCTTAAAVSGGIEPSQVTAAGGAGDTETGVASIALASLPSPGGEAAASTTIDGAAGAAVLRIATTASFTAGAAAGKRAGVVAPPTEAVPAGDTAAGAPSVQVTRNVVHSPSVILLSMPLLLALPAEVSTKVLRKVPASSLALLACTCVYLRERVAGGEDVWHAKYEWYSKHVWPSHYKATSEVREEGANTGGEGASGRGGAGGGEFGGGAGASCHAAGCKERKNKGEVLPALVPPPPPGYTCWRSAFVARWKERKAEVEEEERRRRRRERERDDRSVRAYAPRYAAPFLPLYGPPEPPVWPDPLFRPTYF